MELSVPIKCFLFLCNSKISNYNIKSISLAISLTSKRINKYTENMYIERFNVFVLTFFRRCIQVRYCVANEAIRDQSFANLPGMLICTPCATASSVRSPMDLIQWTHFFRGCNKNYMYFEICRSINYCIWQASSWIRGWYDFHSKSIISISGTVPVPPAAPLAAARCSAAEVSFYYTRGVWERGSDYRGAISGVPLYLLVVCILYRPPPISAVPSFRRIKPQNQSALVNLNDSNYGSIFHVLPLLNFGSASRPLPAFLCVLANPGHWSCKCDLQALSTTEFHIIVKFYKIWHSFFNFLFNLFKFHICVL